MLKWVSSRDSEWMAAVPSGPGRRTRAAPTAPAARAPPTPPVRKADGGAAPSPPSRGSRSSPTSGPGRCGAHPVGEGARVAGQDSGSETHRPREPPRRQRGGLARPAPPPLPHPPAAGPAPRTRRASRERRDRGGGSGGWGRPGEPRADPRKEGEPGRGEPSSGEGALEGEGNASGVGARLRPPQGWGSRRTSLPHPSQRGRGPSGSQGAGRGPPGLGGLVEEAGERGAESQSERGPRAPLGGGG